MTALFYLRLPDGVMRPLTTLPLQIDARTGAMRVEGEVGRQVKLPTGALTLWVAVGRPGSLPTPTPGSRPGRQADGGYLLRVSFRVDR